MEASQISNITEHVASMALGEEKDEGSVQAKVTPLNLGAIAEGDSGAKGNTPNGDENDEVEEDDEDEEDEKVEGEDEEGDDREFEEDDRDRMECEGFFCPKHLVTKLTPMEFEEMVNLFLTYDANGGGTIDKHEARKILQSMDLEATLEKAEELMMMVDADGSGEIDFDEFCEFIFLVKDGDERFKGFDAILDNISDTPLGILEKAASTQGFVLKFETVEVREATATNPPISVVELHMTGMWYEKDEKGAAVGTHMTRKFQGLGQATKEAKYAASKVRTSRFRGVIEVIIEL
jgi:hypothetical protein